MKLFFPLIIYILRARYISGISRAVLRVLGRKRAKREKDGFSGAPGGAALPEDSRFPNGRNGTAGPTEAARGFCRCRVFRYGCCFSDCLFGLGQRMLWGNPMKKDILAAPKGTHLHPRRGRNVNWSGAIPRQVTTDSV